MIPSRREGMSFSSGGDLLLRDIQGARDSSRSDHTKTVFRYLPPVNLRETSENRIGVVGGERPPFPTRADSH